MDKAGVLYSAFISYSHADEESARWLERVLEHYRIPRRLCHTLGAEAERSRRLDPVCRDRDELAAAPDLTEEIRNHLRRSRYLIVICSPHAAVSPWVNEEVRYFKSLGRESQVLGLIVAGEPKAAGGDGECYPPALRHKIGLDGSLTAELIEPLAADLRPKGDGKQNAKLKLVAGILGVGFDELKQRHRAEQRNKVLLWTAAAVIALAVGAVLWQAQEHARAHAASVRLSEEYLRQGNQLVENGRVPEGLAWLAGSLRQNSNNLAALTRTVDVLLYRGVPSPPVGGPFQHGSRITALAFSPRDRLLATAGEDFQVRLWAEPGLAPAKVSLAHARAVNALEFSPDGRWLVTASDDWCARIWDVERGELLGPPLAHEDWVQFVSFAGGTNRLIAVCHNGTVYSWDIRTRAHLERRSEAADALKSAAVSTNGAVLLTLSQSGKARVWETSELNAVMTSGTNNIESATLSLDGRRLLVAAEDTAEILDSKTGRPLGIRFSHDRVSRVAFSPTGQQVITASADGLVKLWDPTRSGAPRALRHAGEIVSVSYSADGARVLTASTDRAARIWNARTGELLAETAPGASLLTHALFSPDGQHVVTAEATGQLWVWESANRSAVPARLTHDGALTATAFFQGGTRLATAAEDGWIRVWGGSNDVCAVLPLKHQGGVEELSVSATGHLLAAASGGGATVWDTVTLRQLCGPLGQQVRSVSLGDNGRLLATGSADGTVQVWTSRTGLRIGGPLRHEAKVKQVAFSPDGRVLASACSDGAARLWNALTGESIGSVMQHKAEVIGVAFSPDGTRVATASMDGTAGLWNAQSGRRATPWLQHSNWVNAVAFSPGGDLVTTASKDRTALIWDVRRGRPIAPALRHEGNVVAIRFDPTGRWVVTASFDRSARVWDAHTGALAAGPFRHDEEVICAEFSPDGRHLVTGSRDGTARIWDLLPPDLTPEWWPGFVEAVAGHRIADEGMVRSSVEELWRWRGEVARQSADSAYAQVARWFFAESRERARTPFANYPGKSN